MSSPSLDGSFIFVGEKEGSRHTSQVNKELDQKEHPSLNPAYVPGSSVSYAHDWSSQGIGSPLRLHGRHFIDLYGRVCNLRGVNLSGSSKIPANDDHGKFPHGHESVTFVGRPFPLEEAHEHFSRLRRWGFTFVRFLVTWEAVEHAGPGIYDYEYLDYIRKLLSLLSQYGMAAFVSLHQDVWSRYSGGSGAPAWTLEAAGFDLFALEESGAAWLGGVKGGGHVEPERGLWPCGYTKLAASTMATLFWGGDAFAPKLLVANSNGEKISMQQYLQNAFLDMFDVLVRAVGDLEGVIGFEMLNEPHRGYIDVPSLHSFDYNTDLHLSHMPTAFQAFQLGAGYPTEVATYSRSFPMPTRHTTSTILNPGGRKAWREDGPTQGNCVWKMHDVWGWDKVKGEAVVLRENYFKKHPKTGNKIDWYTDFYYPFLQRWATRVRSISSSDKIIFVEAIPNEFCPESWTPELRVPNMVYAPHWYDLNALFAKAFGDFSVNVQGLSRGMFPLKAFYWGHKGARENFGLQIRTIVERAYQSLGEKPVIIGECGIPMDMNLRAAFQTDDFTWQKRMMDAMMTGLERSLVGFTLWNYNPDNDDHRGDDWNGENFSWFSRKRALPPSLLYYDQEAVSLDQGARILSAVVRPYPAKTAGIPLRFEYEMTTGTFVYEWGNPKGDGDQQHDDVNGGNAGDSKTASVLRPPRTGHPPITSLETEIFFPSMLARSRKVIVDGLDANDAYRYDESRQTLYVVARDARPGKVHKITVSLYPPLKSEFELNDFWSDFGHRIYASALLVISLVIALLLL